MTEKILQIDLFINKSKLLNETAIKLIFELLYQSLYDTANELIKDSQQSKDIVQESFTKVVECGIQKFNNYEEIHQFLMVHIQEECVVYINDRRIIKQANDHNLDSLRDLENAEEKRIHKETMGALRNAFNKLPKDRKEILKKILNGATTQEIAADLNVNNQSIHSLKHKIVDKLRKSISK